MDPTKTVGATEQTWDAGRTDGWSETNKPPQQLRCAEGIQKYLCLYSIGNIQTCKNKTFL